MWVNCPYHVTRARRKASRENELGVGKFFIKFFLLFALADLLLVKVQLATRVSHRRSSAPRLWKTQRTRSLRERRPRTNTPASEPDWVEEMFELMEALGRMYSDMNKEDRKWKKKIEKRLDEMQETLNEINEPESDGESEKEPEKKKDKGKGKGKEKEMEGDGDVDMGS